MKLRINRSSKRALIIVLVLALPVFAFFIYSEYKILKYTEEEVSVYTYNVEGHINYDVSLKPNIIYNQPRIGEGNIYITELVDRVNGYFNYGFNGDSSADIRLSYRIVAWLEGYEGTGDISTSDIQEDESKSIWRKEFTLVPWTVKQETDTSVTVNEYISLDYMEYNNTAREILDIAKLFASTRLLVVMDVNLRANTEHGSIVERYTQSIAIPLGSNTFKVQKNEIDSITGDIKKTQRVHVPTDYNILRFYFAGSGLAVISIVYLVFFTENKPKRDRYTAALNRLFKKHGSRMVAIKSDIKSKVQNHCLVGTMDDLVRVADEAGKPILYRYNSEQAQISQFYVVEGSWLYIFDLMVTVNNSEIQNLSAENI